MGVVNNYALDSFLVQLPAGVVVVLVMGIERMTHLDRIKDAEVFASLTAEIFESHKAMGIGNEMSFPTRPVQTLSGGQEQRVAIADGGDKSGSESFGYIRSHRTALWVTHCFEELEYADGAVYMEDGRVITHGDAASISKFIKAKQP
ncbi:ABC transporter I family member 10-like [Gossypium raimondii]|uniref:ABC transporter I family member 10-like n=1 Tax=Gossypium raimondii TaxID=29730 RepID=UPI00227CF3CA|nr:ABC transporter I family member 10-like [Gossypium raimondii]